MKILKDFFYKSQRTADAVRARLAAALEFGQDVAGWPAGPQGQYVFASFLLFSWPLTPGRATPRDERTLVERAWTHQYRALREQLDVSSFCPYLEYSVHALKMTFDPASIFQEKAADAVLMLLARNPAREAQPPPYEPAPPYSML